MTENAVHSWHKSSESKPGQSRDKVTLRVWQSEILTKEKPDMKFLLMIKDSQT